MKTYIGDRKLYSRSVIVRDGTAEKANLYYLMPEASQAVFNHSPDGFEWGYGGSGPSQLALAILLDLLGDPAKALKYHHQVKRALIEALTDSWTLTGDQILEAIGKPLSGVVP